MSLMRSSFLGLTKTLAAAFKTRYEKVISVALDRRRLKGAKESASLPNNRDKLSEDQCPHLLVAQDLGISFLDLVK